ncbi:uncharacterized protein LOC114526730 [Dendronephthya gigantea]|uniref:uncharacterized protein LOC114526730 n=1 Tax=Dendronephthya gigantea TaxID=151771 RepID=UPI00106C086F|nr:uncharacterized protein LOC114526730 [Dendronephthya gigantea]
MWRTFAPFILQKQVGLVRSGYSTSQLLSLPVAGHESGDGALRPNTQDSPYAITSHKNIAKAHNTLVGLFLKHHHGVNSKSIKHFLKHVNKHISLVKESKNTDLTICIPSRTGENGKKSGFGFRNIFLDFEKWCYGVVVGSSLISWHRLLFKDERNQALDILNVSDYADYDLLDVNKPQRVLPLNGPAMPIDPLDAACLSFKSTVDHCTAVTENAVAMIFSELKLHQKAFELFLSASAKGNVAAHFNTGLCYEKGLGTTQDFSKAVIFYTLAASYGHLKAAFNAGVMLLQVRGKENAGLEMMEKAAEGNLVKAQRFLGLYYADENGLHDMTKSVHWLKMASKQNDATAQYHLGICYEKGMGLTRNMSKAGEMYRRASENGHARAQYNYALFHEYGRGDLCVDKHKALWWYKTAAENGNVDAKENFKFLQKEIGSNPTLLERLFSDVLIPNQPKTSVGSIRRCSSSPSRLFTKSDLDGDESEQRSGPKSFTHEDSKCVRVI